MSTTGAAIASFTAGAIIGGLTRSDGPIRLNHDTVNHRMDGDAVVLTMTTAGGVRLQIIVEEIEE